MNDLDRALEALFRSKAALPDLMRHLGEGELWVFIPYHPEVEGETMEFKNGMKLPFVRLQVKEGPVVPIFSSFERARESLKKARLPARTFTIGSMTAKKLLGILGNLELTALLNKNCDTGQMFMPPDMLRAVADGSALRPDPNLRPWTEGNLRVIDPADYPTDLVQSAFDILRRHPNFRAAWIFEDGDGPSLTGGARRFVILLHMDPRDAVIFRDYNLVVNSALDPADNLQLIYLDENDVTYLASLWQKAPPFYAAPDYESPPSVMG